MTINANSSRFGNGAQAIDNKPLMVSQKTHSLVFLLIEMPLLATLSHPLANGVWS